MRVLKFSALSRRFLNNATLSGIPVLLLALSVGAVTACEDGPYQTFKPAPSGAGQLWNDGNTPIPTDNSPTQSFQTDFAGGTNKQVICTGEERKARWAKMVTQPIIPPTQAAGIDGVGGPTWAGLTIEQAETSGITDADGTVHGLCQSTSDGDLFGDGTLVNQWGDNGEVWAKYDLSNHNKIEWITVNQGYLGTMDFKSRDGKDTFRIGLDTQITKNGKNYELNWDDDTKFGLEATELADALFATFAPELPAETVGTASCISSGHCTKTQFPDVGALRIYPLGLHIWVNSPLAAQPTPSKPERIDLRLPRVMPYTLGAPELKLDADGPTTVITKLGADGSKVCNLKLGMTWADFLGNCVRTTGIQAKDDVTYNKLTGNIMHDAEVFIFDTSGVDLNFKSSTLGPFSVVLDAARPVDADTAVEVTFDANTLGHLKNDWSADDSVNDLHGSGAVYFEYARLVQQGINDALKKQNPAALTHELGDPACLWPDIPNNGYDPSTFVPAQNCTGFEGFVTAALPGSGTASDLDRIRLGQNAGLVIGTLGLKPGKPIVAFCMDANGDINSGYSYCGAADNYGKQGAMWDTSFQRVTQFLGNGKLANLPPEIRDRRFYFKQFVIALLKYLMVEGQSPMPDLATVNVDLNDLFFDSQGAGQYEYADYVDRRFVSATQVPTDFVVTADILNGTLYSYEFTRFFYRDEASIYQVTRTNQSDPLGKENLVTLTNLFGSPVLAAAYADHPKRSAYQCGSADWTTAADFTKVQTDCEGQLPPLDPAYMPDPTDPNAPPAIPLRENGVPILTPYPAAFAGKGTPFTLGSTNLHLIETFPAYQAAHVTVPRFVVPYDPTSGIAQVLDVLVEPWVPKQPSVGWPWPVNAQVDKLVEAHNADFSGITTSANISYQLADSGTMTMQAVETTSFLGDVFLCQDPVTGDLLRTRMYGSVQTMLDWIDAHPGVYDACDLLVRYSPYNNFPDYIISRTNGVIVGVTPGGGYGRVNDATLFTPGDY